MQKAKARRSISQPEYTPQPQQPEPEEQPQREPEPDLYNEIESEIGPLSDLVLTRENRNNIKTLSTQIVNVLNRITQTNPNYRKSAENIAKSLKLLYTKGKEPITGDEFNKALGLGEDIAPILRKFETLVRANIQRIIQIIDQSEYNIPDEKHNYIEAYKKILGFITQAFSQ